MSGGKLKARPEGYHREVSHLQRLHDKLRLDVRRDARERSRICKSLSEAIAGINALMDREIVCANGKPKLSAAASKGSARA
jgi:hypothetical protein